MIVMTQKLRNLMDELKEFNAETFYHSLRVKNLVYNMLKILNREGITNYTQEDIDCICKGALLHDMGKLFVDNLILTKDGGLNVEEKERMTKHTCLGFEKTEGELNENEYEIIKNILLYHHERCDGSGYEKIKNLPFYIDIVAISDVYDALTSDRVYRKKFSKEKALEIIKSGGSGLFQDNIIECLEKVLEEIEI